MYSIAENMPCSTFPAILYSIAENLKRKLCYIAGTVVPFRPVIDTEEALRQSQATLQGFYDTAPFMMGLGEIDGDKTIAVSANHLTAQFFGQSAENILGYSGLELGTPPHIEALWLEHLHQSHREGQPVCFKYEDTRMEGSPWLGATVAIIGTSAAGRPLYSFIAENITGRKRREQNSAFLDEIGQDLSVLSAPDDIIQTVEERVGQFMQASTCIFADVDEAKNEATIHHGWNTAYVVSLKQTFRLADYFGEEFLRAGRADETVIVRDTGHDERSNAEAYARLKIGSFVTVPFQRQGRWMANITVTSREPRDWRTDEIELLQQIANRVFPSIERARAEEALRLSEEKFRTLFDSIDEGFCIIELVYDEAGEAIDCCYLEVNPVFERQTGLENAAGKLGSVLAPNTEAHWLKTYARVVQTGEPVRFENYHADTQRWYGAYISRVGDAFRRQVAVVFDDITERKLTEERQTYLLKLSDALRPLTDPVEIQLTASRILGEHLVSDRATTSRSTTRRGSSWWPATGINQAHPATPSATRWRIGPCPGSSMAKPGSCAMWR